MSIEAMKQVIELYDTHCYNNDYGGIEFNKKHGYKFIEAIEALRTAIQQAESEPVAVRNPFASRCYTMSESHLSGHRLIVGFEKLEDAQSAHEWVARCGRSNPGELPGMWHESDLIGGETDCEPYRPPHPAPGVPDDVVRDAQRYRWLRERHWSDSELCCVTNPKQNVRLGGFCPSGELLNEVIDAAMLAAAQAQKG